MAEEVDAGESVDKPSMMPKLMIMGFIGMVVVVETVIFFFMVPSADDVAALAEKQLIDKIETNMAADGEETMEENEEFKEFSMGVFNMQFQPPGADRRHHVEFELFGVVEAEKYDDAQLAFEERDGRLRDRMLEEVRHASMDELNDPGLIKRRIFATSNEVLGDDPPLLQGVGFRRYDVQEE